MIFYVRGTKLSKIQIIFLAKQCCYSSSSSQQEKKPRRKKKINTYQLGLSLFNYRNWPRHRWISCKLVLIGICFQCRFVYSKCVRKKPNQNPTVACHRNQCIALQLWCHFKQLNTLNDFPLLTTQVQYPNKSISPQLWHLQTQKKHFWTSRHQKT